jgi:hypothetical protein
MFRDNRTVIDAVYHYLIDNNIPPEYKQMNCIQDTVNTIANRYNDEINVYNNTHGNGNGLSNNMIEMIISIQNVQNIMYNGNH